MNGDFTDRAVCRARPRAVWKLLHDVTRFPDWWAGLDRVEETPDGATRYMRAWPDFAYPTRVVSAPGDNRVVVSCLLSDVVHEWTLEPHPDGCVVAVRLALPEDEAHRMPALATEVSASLRRLVDLAETEDGAPPAPAGRHH